MQASITKKQEEVLNFIRDYYLENGFAPSLGELQEYFHIKTKRGVVSHLEALEKKGFIIRTGEPRGIHLQEENYEYLIAIPILGYANAGIPLACAVEDYLGVLKIDKNLVKGKSNLFALLVKGDSMNKACVDSVQLKDGNYVIVQKDVQINNGDIVLAVIDNYATIKIMKENDGVITLYPNSLDKSYLPIYLDKSRENIINGKVIRVLEGNA